MIQTSYVPLEHPYRIIEYHGTMGIQIGTLIVTVDKSDRKKGYAIETHSHPVVSYVNLDHIPKEHTSPVYFFYDEMEGVAWDNVEVKQVRTVMRIGDPLELSSLMDICREWKLEELREGFGFSTMWLSDAMGKLTDWGVDLVMPPINSNNEMVFEVVLYDYLDDAKAYCLGRGDLGLAVPSAGLEATYHFIVRQVDVYLTFFINLFKLTAIKVIFSTEDKMYAGLTERLNEKFSKGLGYYLEGRDYDALMATEAEPEFEEVR